MDVPRHYRESFQSIELARIVVEDNKGREGARVRTDSIAYGRARRAGFG